MFNARQCVVYFHPEKIFHDSPYNAGVDDALARLIERGALVVDPSQMSDGERYAAYSSAVTGPSVRNKQRVRTLFGSHSNPGGNFGLGIPALVVQDEHGRAREIYPHWESGHIVKISDALARFNI